MATKSEVTTKILEKFSSLDKKIVILVVDMFFDVLSDELKEHNRIEFRRFGSFSIRNYNLRKFNGNLSKDKYFRIYFRSSRSLIDEVNACKL